MLKAARAAARRFGSASSRRQLLWRARLRRGVAELTRLGYEPIYDESVFARDALHAGDRRTRAAAFAAPGRIRRFAAADRRRGGTKAACTSAAASTRTTAARRRRSSGYSDNTSLLSWLTGQAASSASRTDDRRPTGERGERYDPTPSPAC